jgi:hypothetical protein
MISERRLASDFSSFWRTILPLGEAFTRLTNTQQERFTAPLKSSLPAERSGLVSELSFRYFLAQREGTLTSSATGLEPEDLRSVIDADTAAYIATLPGHAGTVAPPNKAEQNVAKVLADRLGLFLLLHEPQTTIEFEPVFMGCGIVDVCKGDVLAEDTLYEIKNVGRDFRAVDWRQLLVYCCLASLMRERTIERIGLVNPRQGRFIRVSLDQAAWGLAGIASADLLGQIAYFVSTEQLSR